MENEGGCKATDRGYKPAYTLGYPGCGWEAVVNVKAEGRNNDTGKRLARVIGENHTTQSTTDVDEAREDNDPASVRGGGDSGSRGFS